MNSRTLHYQQSLRDVWEAIEEVIDRGEASLIRSALLRFTVPGLGRPVVSGERLGNKETANILNFLSTIPIEQETPETLRSAQKKTFEILGTEKQRQRQPRHYLNQFIKRGVEQGFFANSLKGSESEKYVFYPEKIPHTKTTSRGKNQKNTLSFNLEDYTDTGLDAEVVRQELERIQSSLQALESYFFNIKGQRKISIDRTKRTVLLMLGWLYRQKKVSLKELSFNSLVPIIGLNPKFRDFSHEENPWMKHMLAKAIAMEEIKEAANNLVDLLNDFFGQQNNYLGTASKTIYVESAIELAKYIYRNQTDKTMAMDFLDIPIITRLRVFKTELRERKNSNPSKCIEKYIPWNEVIEVFEKVRFEADLTNTKGDKNHRHRPISAIAKDLQECVLLGMYVLVPPPRQRVVRELELGRTLKYGLFVNGRFTPAEKMPNPDEAKHYIHLQPEDYKTGDTYGEWIGEFPNTLFLDGKSFYDYLKRWLFHGYQDNDGTWHGMREILAKGDTNTVFVRDNIGDSFSQPKMSNKIRSLFNRWTKIPIAPHDLRHIYRTYIEDPATGATAGEKESAAFWMRHSEKTAKKNYAHLDCEKKLRLGAQMTERLNQQLLGTN